MVTAHLDVELDIVLFEGNLLYLKMYVTPYEEKGVGIVGGGEGGGEGNWEGHGGRSKLFSTIILELTNGKEKVEGRRRCSRV